MSVADDEAVAVVGICWVNPTIRCVTRWKMTVSAMPPFPVNSAAWPSSPSTRISGLDFMATGRLAGVSSSRSSDQNIALRSAFSRAIACSAGGLFTLCQNSAPRNVCATGPVFHWKASGRRMVNPIGCGAASGFDTHRRLPSACRLRIASSAVGLPTAARACCSNCRVARSVDDTLDAPAAHAGSSLSTAHAIAIAHIVRIADQLSSADNFRELSLHRFVELTDKHFHDLARSVNHEDSWSQAHPRIHLTPHGYEPVESDAVLLYICVQAFGAVARHRHDDGLGRRDLAVRHQ